MAKGPLFDPTRVFERTTSVGSSVRVRVEPLAGERVRVVEYHRKRAGSTVFARAKEEEGHVMTLAQLGVHEPFAEVFGAHAPAEPVEDAAPARRRRRK